jgi:hypothetical protein
MRRFQDLWAKAADDGASCPIGVNPGPPDVDVDQLLDAWYDERAQRIESTLLLGEARRLIGRLLVEAEGSISSRRAREARRLIQAIRAMETQDC